MPLNKIGNFSFSHVNQQDDLYKTKTAAEIKAALDSQANELKVVLNNLIDALQSQVADNSGAENIGIQAITGVTGANVQSALEDLRLQINAAVAGTIPDGSITQAKLAFQIATDAASVSIADVGNHFVSTKVEGALDELFTSANSVKSNVSGAIGSPSTVNDTGVQLAGYITTEKGRIASEVGDGSSADTLKYLIDRLIVRSDAIATAVNAKGVASTSADTLAQLGTKIGLIPSGSTEVSGPLEVHLNDVEKTTTSLTFVKAKETRVNRAGLYRVSFQMGSSAEGKVVHGRIYVNGVARGIDRSTTSAVYTLFSEDNIDLKKDDLLQVYIYAQSTATCYVKTLTANILANHMTTVL